MTWLVAAPCPAAGPQARSDQAQRPEFKSGVDLVAVDVVVVDRDGRPVVDLAPGDFTVTVDGKPRRVVSADFIGHRIAVRSAEPAGAAAVPAPALNIVQATGRLIAIAADLDQPAASSGAERRTPDRPA